METPTRRTSRSGNQSPPSGEDGRMAVAVGSTLEAAKESAVVDQALSAASLSINQTNVNRRNHQVSQISEIRNGATTALLSNEGEQLDRKRKRQPYSAEFREKTKLVRAIGACDNCRRRKLRCDPSHHPHHRTQDENDPVPSGTPQATDRSLQILPALAQLPRTTPGRTGMSHNPQISSVVSDSDVQGPRTRSSAEEDHEEQLRLLQGERLFQAERSALISSASKSTVDSVDQPEAPVIVQRTSPLVHSTPSLQIRNLEEFAKTLQPAAEAVFRNSSRSRYTSAHVLMLRWESEQDLKVVVEMDELARVFSQDYGYHVTSYLIPHERSHQKLSGRILQFVDIDDDKSDTLKILYYRGCSSMSKNRHSSWSSHPLDATGNSSSIVKWTGIQTILEEARSDVLLLLDAEASGVLESDSGKGVTELIAASAHHSGYNIATQSFTKALITELRTHSRFPSFSVSELYSSIFSRIQTWISEDEKQLQIPIYLVLTTPRGTPRRSIFLSPHKNTSLGTEAGKGLDVIVPQNSNSESPSMNNIPRVLFSVKLKESLDPTELSEDLFTEWLRMIPSQVESVKVEACFDSF